MSDLLETLRLAADDPMWADHVEMPKKLLRHTVDRIEALEREVRELRADKARLSEARDDWENEAGEFAKEVDRLKCVIEEMEQERNSFDTHMEAVKRKYRNRAIEAERAAHAALSGSGDGWEYRYNHMNTNKPVDWRDGKGEVFSVLPGYELRRKALPASPSTAGER